MNHEEEKPDTPEQSDPETESFEDAPDTVKKASPEMARTRSSTSGRSLTDRSPRGSLNGRPNSSSSPAPLEPPRSAPAEGEEDENTEDVKTPRQAKSTKVPDEPPVPKADPGSEGADEGKDGDPAPLDTVKTVKRTSASFQEVNIDGREAGDAPERGRQPHAKEPQSPKSTVSGSKSRSTSRTQSISEKVASAASSSGFSLGSWGGFQKAPSTETPQPKKMPSTSGAWGWLSRKKTTPDGSSPPQVARTSSTIIAPNKTDLKLNKLETEPVPAKDKLKERFKLARMKEETGINVDEIAETPRGSVPSGKSESNDSGSRPTSDPIQSAASTPSVSEIPTSPTLELPRRGHRSRTASMAQSISLDPGMTPGTVSGLSQGPSTMANPEAPVDWDLWQSVVYEGPSAVAKTSPEDLSRSIASGIPNPIRGVVWQVLAESKDEALESKYLDLIARGTDKEVNSPVQTPLDAPPSAKSLTAKESLPSSASSVHSEKSGLASPTNPDSDANAAKLEAEKQKKKRDDLASVKKIEKTIRKDLGARSNYAKYFAAKEMQDDLFNVCKAYALYDEAVGYAQGMNFIVMPLLFNMPPEEAFCLLVKLMNNYSLRETFVQDMPGLHRQLYQFERILEEADSKVYRHLNKKGVTPSLYATQWFLTLFAYKFPLQLVLRVYDLVLSEGLESAILKFGIALMQKNSEKLLAIQDMAALKTFLNERLFDAYIDSSPSSRSILEQGFFGSSGGSEKDVYRADLLVQDACAVSIPAETLKEYAEEYENKTKAEKDRQAELEELRATVASQSTKIRSLEERVEKSDTEHVQITQEMIRSRMENEEMKSTGHEQLAEIERLKKELDAAPEKLEASLKEEMERTITRNTEVQSQNRMLEEQMADMEKDLVETKMKFATINGDYETLKQKWSDLRRALGD